MNKKELTEKQKQMIKVSSRFAISSIISVIASIICFAIRNSKIAQLNELVKGTFEYQTNHIALESAISTSNIFAIIFLIITIICTVIGMFILFKSGIFNKEKEETK